MFDNKHYVPVLKGRDGEYGALRELAQGTKDGLTPLIEIPPIPWDFINETPSKSLDDHLSGVAEKVYGAWGRTRPFFLDLVWIPPAERMKSGLHPLTYLLDEARRLGLEAIPVTGPDRDSDYQTAVQKAISTDGRGACIRVDNDYLGDLTKLSAELRQMPDALGVSIDALDLLIDLQEVNQHNESLVVTGTRAVLAGLPDIAKWRTLTLAAAAFPENLKDVTAGSISTLSRVDWSLWLSIRDGKPARIPSFGDYGVAHPEPSEQDPRLMRMSANLRYSRSEVWLVLKGRNVRDYGYDQFQDLCAVLVSRSGDYDGAKHCWGDAFIDQCAHRNAGPGNATIWRKIATNHHLTRVVEDVQKL